MRGLPQTAAGAIAAGAADDVLDLARDASAVLVGPGMSDVDECCRFLERLLPELASGVVLDALAIARIAADAGALHHLAGRAVLTPNPTELARTLGVDESEVDAEPASCAARLAVSAQAIVALGGTTSWVAAPDGRRWHDETGGSGLGVSGSGDVLAGIVAGLIARGAEPVQAAVWATHLHGRAGERLAASVGRLGFLARELLPELPRVLAEVVLVAAGAFPLGGQAAVVR